MKMTCFLLLSLQLFWLSCEQSTHRASFSTPFLMANTEQDSTKPAKKPVINTADKAKKESPVSVPPAPKSNTPSSSEAPKEQFTDVVQKDPTVLLDIRYATDNNFTKSKIYDCPRCLLRPEAAEAVLKAQKQLQKKGYGLKMFDCYRPRPYQQRLWDKVPNPDYVTPPAKGSMHSRGAAVDLTIVDVHGKELNMGTEYDFFGEAAHTDNLKLPADVLKNRALLRETMESVGFKGIRTEWWHFSYQRKEYALSDYVWPCK
jgi:D-alanyl-D-alanine dipeptidase